MKLMTLSLAGLLAAGTMQTLRADDHAGAGLGAIIGGVAGGIIGHQSDETAAGVALGAVAGAVVGHVVDSSRDRTVIEYRSGPGGRWDDRRPRPVIIQREPPRPVVIRAPRPATPPVVIVVKSEPTPVVIGADDCTTDVHGYSSADYLALLKPAELGVLRQRAYGDGRVDLADYLTDLEKGNLRARAARQIVIGEAS